MKKPFGRRNDSVRKPPAKPVLLISGDAQAEAAALILQKHAFISASYEVVYYDTRRKADVPGRETLSACAYSFEQQGSGAAHVSRLPRNCRRIVFPALRFRLLWPLTAPNPYNRPDGAAPGPFPWGDSFITSCIERGVSADEILRHYQGAAWPASWPNLDVLFKDESAALSAADAKCDVKIGSFVLKHFRKIRMFWAMNAPANHLLGELVYRLLHAAFGAKAEVDRASVQSVLAELSGRDLLGLTAVPVHPLVAQHFSLEWYDPQAKYSSLNQQERTFSEYYRDMIAHAQSATR